MSNSNAADSKTKLAEKSEVQTKKFPIQVKSVFPKRRQDVLNINGWGFSDSYFTTDKGNLKFTGNRYSMCDKSFLKSRQLLLSLLKADINDYKPYENPVHKESDYPSPKTNDALVNELKKGNIEYSLDFDDRFFRCRGQSTRDFYVLRFGKFERIPDLVVWPRCHDEVVTVVKLANKYQSVIIPYGGGTNITLSLNYTKKNNDRFFISLDMSLMNRILWIDDVSMLACIEAGIVGKDLEDALSKEGYTMGHEPDSLEFSTLGGWVATRSSGMKQQTYGNIEDMISKVTVVTSVGILEKSYLVPRGSVGPDYDQMILGSEGTLGVITKVTVRIHKKPQVRRYGSILFPDFAAGIKFMYDVSQFPMKPSNLRLVDKTHVQLGTALEHFNSLYASVVDRFKKMASHVILRYNFEKAALAIYLIEGDEDDVENIENKMRSTSWKYWGISGGARFGERTYLMTFTVCYIRDLFFDLGFLFDSVEPSVSWAKCLPMIEAINHVWDEELKRRKIFNIMALRISQIYNDGVCVYFYYGIGPTMYKDQLETFEELTDLLRQTILASGGNLSHHHGIGKKSSKWYPRSVSRVGVEMFHAIKSRLDPNNIFDAGNLVEDKTGAKL